MISDHKIDKLCAETGFDRVTAWRVLRDQAILQRRYAYQAPSRYREGNS